MTDRIAYLLLLLLTVFAPAGVCADTGDPAFPTNPNIADKRCFVADAAGALTPQTVDAVNSELYGLRRATTVEMGVAIVRDTGDWDIQSYAVELFELWGLGQTDRDNGVLLVVSIDSRQCFLMTGYGVEGALPDFTCSEILADNLIPAMKRGDADAGVLATVGAVVKTLSDPAVADELRSATPGKVRSADGENSDSKLFHYFIGLVTIIALILLVRDSMAARRLRSRHERALMWRRNMLMYWVLACLSLGGAIVPALLATLLYRRNRTRRRRCSVCGAKMKRLSETDDNHYLTPAQQLEEQIKSVDYDVWRCPKCNNTESFAFRTPGSGYTECPHCHTVAMRLKENVVLQDPTTRSRGRGERVYECLYCGHNRREPYDIPVKEDSVAAAAALGAIVGSMGARSGGFGGGMGGGFGGGSTGGGGAGGNW